MNRNKIVVIYIKRYLVVFAKKNFLIAPTKDILSFENITFIKKHTNKKYYKEPINNQEKLVGLKCLVNATQEYVEKAITALIQDRFDTTFYTYIETYLELKAEAQIKEAIYSFMSKYGLHETTEFDTLKKKYYRYRLAQNKVLSQA